MNVGDVRALIANLPDDAQVVVRGSGFVDVDVDQLDHDTSCTCDCSFSIDDHPVSMLEGSVVARVDAVLGLPALVFTVEIEA